MVGVLPLLVQYAAGRALHFVGSWTHIASGDQLKVRMWYVRSACTSPSTTFNGSANVRIALCEREYVCNRIPSLLFDFVIVVFILGSAAGLQLV